MDDKINFGCQRQNHTMHKKVVEKRGILLLLWLISAFFLWKDNDMEHLSFGIYENVKKI